MKDWPRALIGDLSTCCCRHRPGRRRWPDQELDRQIAAGVSHHSPAISAPDRDLLRPIWSGEERMSMLAELVEVVIGVDTHTDTHTAVVVDARTGGVLTRTTVPADPDGYAPLVAVAEQHTGLRAWAMEGTGGYGAGLARHLDQAGELVIELDRPARPARGAGAKSDPIDAERAARDALARTRLAQPKTGAERAALQMRLTARRAAVEAAGAAQRQLLAMVITAPEAVRARFRGQGTRAVLATAARLRPASGGADIEVSTALTVL